MAQSTLVQKKPKPNATRLHLLGPGICLLIALIWPASYFWSDGVQIFLSSRRIEITTGPGWATLTYGWADRDSSRTLPISLSNRFIRVDAANRSALSFTRIYSLPGDYRFYFPLWMLSSVMGIVALGLLVSHARARQRHKPGCCANCGYDLRATPDRCPECGRAIGVVA